MGCIKVSSKMEFYNSKCILQKKKRDLRQPNFTPQEPEKEETKPSTQKEGNNKDQSGNSLKRQQKR